MNKSELNEETGQPQRQNTQSLFLCYLASRSGLSAFFHSVKQISTAANVSEEMESTNIKTTTQQLFKTSTD